MPPEPLIGGLTADQLITKATNNAQFLLLGKVTEADLKLLTYGAAAGAAAMYRTLVDLGKELLDPVPNRPLCTCPDIEMSTLGQEPGTGNTVKGLATDCPIHGRPTCGTPWCVLDPGHEGVHARQRGI